jgi:hypothetical protein
MIRNLMTRWNGEAYSTTAANAANCSGAALTLETLREAQKIMGRLPPAPAFDVWPHDLLVTDMYELNGGIAEELGYITKGRRQLIVPRVNLEYVAHELRRHGADVRVEPVIRKPEAQPDTTGEKAP